MSKKELLQESFDFDGDAFADWKWKYVLNAFPPEEEVCPENTHAFEWIAKSEEELQNELEGFGSDFKVIPYGGDYYICRHREEYAPIQPGNTVKVITDKGWLPFKATKKLQVFGPEPTVLENPSGIIYTHRGVISERNNGAVELYKSI